MLSQRENPNSIALNLFAWQEKHYMSKNSGIAFRSAIILSNISYVSLVVRYY